MCASYGLGGDGRIIELADGLDPMSEKSTQAMLSEWMTKWGGHAKITGRKAINLNPVVSSEAVGLGWWSLPRPTGGPAFNARVESLLRVWKEPFQMRALLPASWYDEGKMRWQLPGGEAFMIAAITAPVEHDGTEYLGYSMVTRSGVGEASKVVSARGESRMPLLIPEGLRDDWLDPDRAGDKSLVAEVQHASEEISHALTTA